MNKDRIYQIVKNRINELRTDLDTFEKEFDSFKNNQNTEHNTDFNYLKTYSEKIVRSAKYIDELREKAHSL